MNDTCSTCRFFLLSSKENNTDSRDGVCRAHPPIAVIQSSNQGWSIRVTSIGWCGEWESKPLEDTLIYKDLTL